MKIGYIKTSLVSALALQAAFGVSGYSEVKAQGAGVLEEIMVTARKREESLQDAPISIQAFTADGLERRAITDVSEIGEFTPNMVFDSAAPIGGSNSSAVVFIRGVGQSTAVPTQDLGVGTYIDGIYLARSVGGVLDLIDVERIEVLRGPQGTLFGRNTIGGAINITSKKPTDEFGGNVALTFGSDEQVNVRGMVNGPIADNLFANASVLYKKRDGYVDRPDGTDLGNDDSIAGRVALRWEATDTFTVDFAADITSIDENGAPFVATEIVETAAFGQFHNAFIAPFGECFFGPGGPPSPISNTNCYNPQWVSSDDETDFGTFEARDELDLWGVTLNTEWDITDSITLKSFTSYRDSESTFALDQDHSPLEIAHVLSEFNQEQFTQEFQLLGDHLEGRLNWIFGLYYFQEEGETFEVIDFSPVSFQSGGTIDNTSKAAFAQSTFEITDRLSVTGGVRYTEDTKRFTPDQQVFTNNNALVPRMLLGFGPGLVPPSPPPGSPLLPPVEAEEEFEEVTLMGNVSYSFTDDLSAYFTYSEGFKSGGFTQRIFPPLPAVPVFEPESVEVYEIGLKSTWLDDRLRLNIAAFHNDYTDLQFTVQDVSVAPVVRNAGAATIRGAEIDLAFTPIDGLLIEGGLGYLDASYDEVDVGTGLSLDNELVKAPEWTSALGIAYDIDMANYGVLTPRIDWTYSSSIYNDAINSPQIKQDSYHIINAGLTYEDPEQLWRVSLIGKNLGDEKFISAGFSDTVNLGVSEVLLDRGREWSITVKRSF